MRKKTINLSIPCPSISLCFSGTNVINNFIRIKFINTMHGIYKRKETSSFLINWYFITVGGKLHVITNLLLLMEHEVDCCRSFLYHSSLLYLGKRIDHFC